jgi:hypothetical protein
MSVTDSSPTVEAPARQAYAPWLAYVIFTLCSSLYLLPFMRVLLTVSDEGIFLCGAARIVHGQVFARDFFEIVGPGTFYLMAAFFKLFGVTFLAARIGLFVQLLGTCLAIYYLSRQVCAKYQWLPCLFLTGPYFGFSGQTESHHVDSNFLALLSVVCLVLWHTRRRNSLLVAAGALAGATTCFLQPKGVLLIGASIVWLWLQRRRIASSLFLTALASGGFLSLVGLVLAYFWSQGALGSLVYANYVFPSHSYGAANSVVYGQGIKEIWAALVTQQDGLHWPAEIAAILMAPFLFVAALPALLLVLSVRYKWSSVRPEIVLYWLCGSALWLSEFHRRDIHHLAYGSPLLIVLCVHMLGENRSRLIHIAVWIFAVCAVCLAMFNWLLAASVHSVSTRVGSVAAFGPGSGPVLNFLNKDVGQGEDILVYPCSPAFYFLSSATNPTPYSCLYYNQSTPSQFQAVEGVLEQRRVRYVIWDTTWLPKLAKGGLMPGSQPSSPDQLILEPYLQSHYTTVKDEDGVLVMERKHGGN